MLISRRLFVAALPALLAGCAGARRDAPPQASPAPPPPTVAQFTAPSNATPSLVVDARTLEVLHAENAGRAWYPASTTKLVTAFVAFEQVRAGRLTLASDVVFSRNALGQQSVESGLAPGRVMSLEDALYAMLGASANDAAVAIAETVGGDERTFVGMMNDAARRLGMTGSHFANPEGLFDAAQVTTARDLAVLAAAINRTYPDYLRFFDVSEVVIDGRRLSSQNLLLTRFSGAIGLKTGFLCASGRNIVGLANGDGRRLIVVVLGAATERERAERAAALLRAAFARPPTAPGPTVLDLRNDAGAAPEDMRTRICSPQAAAYELEQDRRYPMGLAGTPSNLGPPNAPKVRAIRTRGASPSS